MSNPYDSKLMAALRDEERFDQEHQKGQRQVKLEKGHVWTVRFLPAKLGDDGTWYARIARHWLNKKPIICPVDTAPAFGGNPDAFCPCCDVAAEINRSSDEEVSKVGWNCRATSQRLTFCVVIDKDGEAVVGNEMMMAYEFWHYQNTWDELKAFFKAGTRGGKNMTSVLDYRTGNDFSISRNAKGLRLDKLESGPIFDPNDEHFESHIKKIEESIKQPKVKIPTDRDLQLFAGKIEEEAEKVGRGGTSPGRRQISSASDEDLDGNGGEEQLSAPAARRPSPTLPPSAPKARRPADDDSNPELMPAKTQARRSPPQPAQEEAQQETAETEAEAPAPPPRQPAAQPKAAPAPAAPAPAARPQTTVPRARAATPAAAPVDSDADLAPEPAEETQEAEQEQVEPPRRAPAAAAAARPAGPKRASTIPAGKDQQIDDDPDVLPEEQTDQAPPVKQPLRKAVDTSAAPDEQAETPPPAPARKTGMGNGLRDKVRQASDREG